MMGRVRALHAANAGRGRERGRRCMSTRAILNTGLMAHYRAHGALQGSWRTDYIQYGLAHLPGEPRPCVSECKYKYK